MFDLPQNWQKVSLGSISDIDIGGTPSRIVSAFWSEKPDGNPWLSIADLKEKYLTATREHISDLGARSSNVKLIEPQTLVMSFKLSLGKAGITSLPMFCNEAIAIFRPKAGVSDHRWLYFALPRAANSAVTDTAVKGATLNKASLAKLPLDFPPLPHQSKIAEILDTLDAAIRGTGAVVAKLAAMKQGLLHDLLTRGIDQNGDLRPPYTDAPHLYHQTPLGWLPKGWDAAQIGDLIDQNRPIVYGILMPGYGYPGGIPVVKVKDIVGGKIRVESLLRTDPKIDYEYRRSRLKAADLLYTIRGSVGRMAVVPPELEDANITQDTARIVVRGIDTGFVAAALDTAEAKRFVANHTIGVAVQGINLRDVRRIPVPKPPAAESKMIAQILAEVDKRAEQERAFLAKLRLQKSGLMEDLLTGRVSVAGLLAPEGAAHGA